MVRRSILSTSWQDFLCLFLPGLSILAFSFFIPQQSMMFIGIMLLVTLIDSGHVYTTVWRTWLKPGAGSNLNLIYWLTPVLVILTPWLFFELSLPGLWMLVVYFTVFHNIRQLYGILKWYEFRNARLCQWSGRFLYFFCALAFLGFHFREGIELQFYTTEDYLAWPNAKLYQLCWLLLAFGGATWLGFEWQLMRRGLREWNRIAVILLASSMYILSMMFGTNELQILGAIMLSHGIAYLALMNHSLRVIDSPMRGRPLWILAALSLTVLLAGAFELYFEERFFDQLLQSRIGSWILGLYLVPLICHFLFDGMIWRKTDPDFAKILRA